MIQNRYHHRRKKRTEDGEEDFGDVVGKDYEGEEPEEGGKARNGAEYAVEEEKGGVFECGGADAIENLH